MAMSRYDYYGYFKPSRPRETTEGIKARSKRGAFAKNWWATRWIETLERLVDSKRLGRGRRYARAGQVVSLKEVPGGVEANVQGSRRTPYKVSISVEPLSDKQWERVVEALADQAIFSVQLLAGEMPAEIEQVFTAAGVSLFPDKRAHLHTDCSCPDWANPCKHVAAVHYILGEQFDEDPFLLFRLRGRSQKQLLAELRARRTGEADEDFEEEEIEEPALPLSETLADFWGTNQPLKPVKTAIEPPPVTLPILKRLGQPSFLADDNLIRLLGPVYQAIADQAVSVAYEQEELETAGDARRPFA
jgi:uncharacterized Zn finger protein